MTHSEQAALIWPVLVLAAKMHLVLTYGDLEGYTGIMALGQGNALGLIHSYCEHRGHPHLNAIVVAADTGVPGTGYPSERTLAELLAEHMRVFGFDWSSAEKPRSQDFTTA